MITKFKAIIFALLFSAPSAFAGYTTMTIEGVQQANGVWTAAGVVDNMGFVRTTGAVTVLGQTTKNLPVAMAVDVPAASNLLKLGSKALGPIALAATAYDVYQWATSTDITSTGDQWILKSDFSNDYGYTIGSEWYSTTFAGTYSSPDSACKALSLSKKGSYLWSPNYKISLSTYSSYACTLHSADWVYQIGSSQFNRRTCSTGSTIQSCKTPSTVTDGDFLKLPTPSLPVLASGLNKLPSLAGKPLPITGTNFTPFSMWQGEPYFKDGSWYRDRMDISPCPTASQPTRVCVDIGPQKFEGATDPQTIPSQATGTASGSNPKENADFCKKNPQSIACAELGELEDENLEVDERPVDVSYTPWGSSNAQCPADKIIPLWDGHSIALSYGPICQFASLLRPLVIALAFVAAGFIVAGITRKGGGDA
ncbi:virulence factor TspB C-terminal domain-related protein [Aeromonas hydrophila]|uniref:virulence factor TspB C-terminal domain-related protein n=1 Tax=Aeromonas hydrophila TaxID=644 RepID=UPI000D256A61|nr:virulence factor TspB C-terminal domain-related protein [Aeromonas hydrophila]AWA06643.1 hypothetical protein C1A23_13930 [Aeromonas hydrophila subsp. hydrophila]AWA06653.1 hypothetical protein C1A23_13985 [Aeromonas hydrophila subsp. hydrophila]